MRVTIFTNPELAEEYVDIHCLEKTDKVRDIEAYITRGREEIHGRLEDQLHRIPLQDILYFESVDKKCFACTPEHAFATEYSLKVLAEQYEAAGFVRISKAFIVNLYHIDYIKSDFEMRILAHLDNQEVLVINRSYKRHFQTCLKRLKEKMTGGRDGTD